MDKYRLEQIIRCIQLFGTSICFLIVGITLVVIPMLLDKPNFILQVILGIPCLIVGVVYFLVAWNIQIR